MHDLLHLCATPLPRDTVMRAELVVGSLAKAFGYQLERRRSGSYALRSLRGEYLMRGLTLGEVVDTVIDHPRQRPNAPEKKNGKRFGWMKFISE